MAMRRTLFILVGTALMAGGSYFVTDSYAPYDSSPNLAYLPKGQSTRGGYYKSIPFCYGVASILLGLAAYIEGNRSKSNL